MGGGPPRFPQGSTCPVVLGNFTEGSQYLFAYRTFTVSGQPSQTVRLRYWFFTPRLGRQTSQVKPRNTERTTPAGFNIRNGFGSSRFARRYSGNRVFFLFLGVLRWFSSPRWLPNPYFIQERDDRALPLPGFPIRTSPGHSLFAAFRGLSQLTTSFIAYRRQGIPRAPLVA